MARHDDKGPLNAILSIAHESQRIYLDFGKEVTWLAMTATQAREFAADLLRLAKGLDPTQAAKDELTDLKEQIAKLQRFKDWVHAYLDTKGVPHHPPGPHGAEGCRIGDRMDWVFARLEENHAT